MARGEITTPALDHLRKPQRGREQLLGDLGGLGAANGFLEFSGLDVSRADADATDGSVLVDNADLLQVGAEFALGDSGDVLTDTAFTLGFTAPDNFLADAGAFATVFTYSGHYTLLIRSSRHVGYQGGV